MSIPQHTAEPGMSSSRRTGGRLPCCQTCGDVVGVYEPIVLMEPTGRRETSIAAEPGLRDAGLVCHHRACADRLDESSV